ncbi:uncharacterized protein LOC118511545 isoform X1 [Anopheles stephensi]|uniref:uncharacterized protein LOC118511545 isoform X1 n=1 Tax=Anopheles stephensi TaxID=30069 RepID=UPI001658C0A0|nr:uncharacterized protein LOC118511545 isoform X1 [Anopheles stephensi]
MRAAEGTEAANHTDTKNHTMVHSGALVSHYLLRPLSSAAVVVVAAAPIATVLDRNSSSSSSSVPLLLRLPSCKSYCVKLPSIGRKPSKPSSPLVAVSSSSSSSCLSPQRKSTSILIVSNGSELPECRRNSGEEATHKKKGRLVYEAHSPYRSVAAYGRFRRQRRSIVGR